MSGFEIPHLFFELFLDSLYLCMSNAFNWKTNIILTRKSKAADMNNPESCHVLLDVIFLGERSMA